MKDEYVEYYVIQKGDTLYKIAKEKDVNLKLLAELNGLKLEDYIYEGETLLVPKKQVEYYITKEDDTLKTVSNIFDTTQDNLINQNKSIYLLPGQMIFYKR